MNIDFSVIIPVYNSERTIERCLDSLIKQHSNRAEIIVIDDGSTDRTGDLVQAYVLEYPEIKYYYQENAGVSCARNKGLDIARGTYITFVDSDDYVADHYFEKLADSREADLTVFADSIERNGVKTERDLWERYVQGSIAEKICGILFSRICGPCNKRYKNSIIQDNCIRFDKSLYLGEDFLFNLNYMLKCNSIEYSHSMIYCVNESTLTSLTRKTRHDYYSQALDMYEKAFLAVQNNHIARQDTEQIIRTLDYIYCRTAFACAEDIIEGSQENKFFQIRQLVKDFSDVKCKDSAPLNFIHFVMQNVLEKRLSMAVYMVSGVHLWIRKIKNSFK